MIAPLIVSVYVLFFSFLVSRLSKTRIIEMAPVSIFFAIIWMTVFGIINKLKFGAIALLPMLVIVFLITYFTNRNVFDRSQVREFFELPILLFVLVIFWTNTNSNGMQFFQWDEFVHWGATIKSMYLFDVIGPESPARLNNPGYPPGLAVFSYLIFQLKSGWSESTIFWSYQIIFFSIVFAMISRFNYRKFWFAFTGLVILLLSSIVFFDFFQTVYSDPMLAVVFGYSLFLATDKNINKKRFGFIQFSLTISVLYLIKEIGFVLGAISVLVLIVNLAFVVDKNALSKMKYATKVILPGLISGLVLYSTRFSWIAYVCSHDYQSGESLDTTCGVSSSSTQSIGKSFFGTPLVQSYIEAIFNRPITPWNGILLSTGNWIFIILCFLVLFSYSNSIDRFRRIALSLGIAFGSIVYLAAIVIAYATFFGSTAQDLPSFDRYAATYFAGVLFFLAIQACQALVDNTAVEKKAFTFRNPALVFALSMFLVFYSPQGRISQFIKTPTSYSDQMRAQFLNIKQKIEFANFSVTDRIYVITQHKTGYEYYYLSYELLPASAGAEPFSIGSDRDPSDFWTDQRVTLPVWDQKLNEYDYVIIYNTSESFIKEYAPIFDDPNSIEEQSIYYVEHSKNGNKLVKFI